MAQDSLQKPIGISDAMYDPMKAELQAKVRRILTREFYRRGRLTWDMKMALRRVLAARESERLHGRP